MLLNWPTDEIRKKVSARIREQRYQARMRKLKEATGDYWSTHFALWPRRISKHNVVWLDWYQAMESSWGWQYSECPVNQVPNTWKKFWAWLWL